MAEAMAVVNSIVPVVEVISKLAAKASPLFGGDATAEKMDNLRTTILPQIRRIIDHEEYDDIYHVRENNDWGNKLRVAALEAEDVLDDWEYRCIEDRVRPPAPVQRPMIQCFKKLKERAAPVLFKTKLMKRVEKLEKFASGDRFVSSLRHHGDSPPNQSDDHNRDTTVPSLPPFVVGREQEREYWVRLLTSPTDEEAKSSTQVWRAPIHAICSVFGGTGKTTLAQYVFNDPRIIGQFGDMRIWVHVPRRGKLDVPQATRNVIEFITKDECPRMENLGALQAKLRDIFETTKSKILLILDDLWADKPDEDRIQLEMLLQPLNEVGRIGNRVLITTRMSPGSASMLGATNVVPLKELDHENCRSIILHYANRHVDDLNFEEKLIFDRSVSKLKNSPLAARLVGNRLRVYDWNMTGNALFKNGDPANALLWSFDRLPTRLKRCFAFCSLYPKGFAFINWTVDELVRFWISQGFIEEPTRTEKFRTIEEKGKHYFDELRFFSFFQQHPHLKGAYVIHDLLHDLATRVSEGHCFRVEDYNMSTYISIPPTVMHLSISARGRFNLLNISELMKLVNLRTFLILDISDDDFKLIVEHGEKMFKKFARLRVLHFGSNNMDELNSSVRKLKHLRYLQGYVFVRLSESLGTLYHLQYIHLVILSSIDRVPKNFNNLVKLRHVHPAELYSMIDDIGKLTSLSELEVYGVDRTKQYGLQQLEKLTQIGGRLTIEGLEFVKDKEGATIAMLNEKRHLEELVLKWDDNRAADVDPDTCQSVLEGLEPHQNLKMLDIMYYNGANPPSWMLNDRQGWLLNLTALKLAHCPNLTLVPNLPRGLRELTVYDCPKLKQLYPYPRSLEVLELIKWPGTEVFLSSAVESYNKREQQQQQVLMMFKCSIESLPANPPPSLRSLTICECSEIEALPNLPPPLRSLAIRECSKIESLPNLPSSLESLRICKCHPRLEANYKEGGPLRHEIDHIPDINIS